MSTLPCEGSGQETAVAVQQSVSPRSFRQLMSLARSKLYDIEGECMQNTVEESTHLSDDIFPLPLPLKPGPSQSWRVRT